MTAVVGILNKHGIAIAADSAVTVSGTRGRKVYNYANKIYTLSKHHPVGVAIYNDALFMGTPWEVLIKEYRRQLGTSSFPTLNEYRSDFFQWLISKGSLFDKEKDEYLVNEYVQFVQNVFNEAITKNKIPLDKLENELPQLLDNYTSNKESWLQINKSTEDLDEDKVKGQIKHITPKILDEIKKKHKTKSTFKDSADKIEDAFCFYLKHDQFLQFSGLVFAGFGDDEILPRLLPTNVSILIGDQLRCLHDQKKEVFIGTTANACIVPFAQTDVIDTLLRGLSPSLEKQSTDIIRQFFTSFLDEIIKVDGMQESVKNNLKGLNIESYLQKYRATLENIIRERSVNPVMNAVSHLSKEDLAEMAESLVFLTYLKKRFTMEEESVGGPVDVAVITRGDGFIWIKRKYYFDPKLNPSYFQKYL